MVLKMLFLMLDKINMSELECGNHGMNVPFPKQFYVLRTGKNPNHRSGWDRDVIYKVTVLDEVDDVSNLLN